MISVDIYRPLLDTTGYIDRLNLSGQPSKFCIINIDGIDYVDKNIFTDNVSPHYGSLYRGWSVNDREISIDVKLLGDIKGNRRELQSFLNTGSEYRLEFTDGIYSQKPLGATAFIIGYVKAIDYKPFTNNQVVTLTFTCPYPYFTRADLNVQPSFLPRTIETLEYMLKNRIGLSNTDIKELFALSPANRQCICKVIGNTAAAANIVGDVINYGDVPVGPIFAFKTYYSGVIQINNFRTKTIPANVGVIIDMRPCNKGIWYYSNHILERVAAAANGSWLSLKPGSNTLDITVPYGPDNSGLKFVGISVNAEYEGL